MSSEHLASAQTELKGDLGASWNILDGASANYTDLGIARRFGGAAAAYSLRDIGAMNGPVVNVRREPHDDDNPGVTDETDFSASQVASGALEDWVNGKLETTLPADVATAEAAYSLRKVKADYSGDAVRIRRGSDDVEVDVAFDSDDKVSASSAITNVAEQGGESGSTTATDLNGFLNETLTVGTAVNGTGSFPYDRFTANGNTGFDADNKGGGISSAGFPYAFANGDVFVIRYTVSNFDNESGLSPGFRGTTGTSTVTQVAGGGTTFTANGTYTDTLTATADGTHIMCADGNTGSYTISNFEVLSHTHSAFVHTWYDQAGSNDATQTTAANQPQIAENGALLTKRGQTTLKFRGTDSVPISLGASASITASHSVFIVGQPSPDGATALDGNDVANNTFWSGGNSGVSLHIAGINSAFSEGYRNSGDASRIFSYTATQEFHTSVNLHTAINGSSNFSYYANTVSKISDLNGAGTDTAITIGKKTGIDSHNTRGFISELIQYNSDQTDNRFKIESNINNYYGLYNDANEMATDWSDDPTAPYGSAFTSNGKDGYTIDYSAGVASTRARWQFANNVPSGEVVYYSFNASITSGTPAVILKQSNGTSNANSNSVAITNGFNSGSITTNAEAVYFAIGDTEGTQNFTISDFKISLIARNGFVETWYDQSGSGNDAVQTTATEQPSVVKNGGIVKLNGKPSVDFDGVDNYFTCTSNLNFNLDPISVSRPVNTIMFVGENTAGSRSFLGDKGSTKNWIAAPYNGTYQFRDNGSTIYDTTVSATLGSQLVLSIQCPSEDNFSIRENGSAKTLGGTNNISAAIGIRDIGVGYTLSGNPNYQTMKAQEFYFHKERLPNDIVDIENDAINYYNIS